MLHIRELSEAKLERPSIVTIGVFDGVHRGHQLLINRLVDEARATNRLAVVLSFFPHPDVVIRGITDRYYLTTPDERARLLGGLGVDVVVTHPFNEQVRQMRAAQFTDQLCEYLNLSTLWATPDFALGYKREGTIDFLREQGQHRGFTVETISLLHTEHDEIIASSTIRQALETGDLPKANNFLGRAYSVSGEVVHGEKRGRKIGFPTANLDIWPQQIIPQHGVYACWATVGGETFMAVTNIGNRPTFAGQGVTVEAHLLDFERDIYGQQVELAFVARLRGEVKFSGIETLISQIRQDVEDGRRVLS
ncbi:MAG: bifunctional riboflavin kinase/FAD synthetase [Anaerolineales bacterium]|nr:bifunctional riboflavin kinase/FAD synthetase [Anaerolineales bacterium]